MEEVLLLKYLKDKHLEDQQHIMENRHLLDNVTEDYAKYIVSRLFHYTDGKKYVGEKYNMDKASRIYEEYKRNLNEDITDVDMYIALNVQYHGFCNLFREWFGPEYDSKIIESTVRFWFDKHHNRRQMLHNMFKDS